MRPRPVNHKSLALILMHDRELTIVFGKKVLPCLHF
jgi:hypothetical protein